MAGQLRHVEMVVESDAPNLRGTNMPNIDQVGLALRDQDTGHPHYPVILTPREDSMVLASARRVNVDVDAGDSVVALYVEDRCYEVIS